MAPRTLDPTLLAQRAAAMAPAALTGALLRAHPGRRHRASAIARLAGLSTEWVDDCLPVMAAAGLVDADAGTAKAAGIRPWGKGWRLTDEGRRLATAVVGAADCAAIREASLRPRRGDVGYETPRRLAASLEDAGLLEPPVADAVLGLLDDGSAHSSSEVLAVARRVQGARGPDAAVQIDSLVDHGILTATDQPFTLRTAVAGSETWTVLARALHEPLRVLGTDVGYAAAWELAKRWNDHSDRWMTTGDLVAATAVAVRGPYDPSTLRKSISRLVALGLVRTRPGPNHTVLHCAGFGLPELLMEMKSPAAAALLSERASIKMACMMLGLAGAPSVLPRVTDVAREAGVGYAVADGRELLRADLLHAVEAGKNGPVIGIELSAKGRAILERAITAVRSSFLARRRVGRENAMHGLAQPKLVAALLSLGESGLTRAQFAATDATVRALEDAGLVTRRLAVSVGQVTRARCTRQPRACSAPSTCWADCLLHSCARARGSRPPVCKSA